MGELVAAGAFCVRTLRSLNLGTRRVLPGVHLLLDARTAAEFIRNGQAVLADDAELPGLVAAVGNHRKHLHAP